MSSRGRSTAVSGAERMRRALVVAGCGVLGVSLSACESTEQESAKLNREGQQLLAGQGALKLGAVNHSVKVSDVSLFTSSGRAAVAMRLTGTSTRGQVGVPVLVNVTGPGGKLLYSNETAGLETSLQRGSVPNPGQAEWWVDDQVLLAPGSSDGSAKVSVHIGTGTGAPAAASVVPRASGVQLGAQDGLSTVSGRLVGRFPAANSKVPVYAVALRAGHVVAAGRAVVSAPSRRGEPAPFQIFLVGDATGASLQLSVAPADG